MVASGFRTVEGPTIAPDGSLYFSDVRGGGVYRLSPLDAVELVVPKRRGVGGICLHADGGIVVSGRDLSHVKDGETRVIITPDDISPADGVAVGGFNDIGADPSGRIFAGGQRMTPEGDYGPGLLVMVTGEHVGRVVFNGLLPNGNAVSIDERFLYQVDSIGRRVLVIDLQPDPPRVTRTFSTETVPGMPDGMAVDDEGQLWIAFHHGGCVGRFRADGALTSRIDIPTPTVTSLCFGPPGTHDLFVVTDDESDSAEPQGCIYRLDVGVGGGPVHAARV
jgi:xylono-1,5-lactonase